MKALHFVILFFFVSHSKGQLATPDFISSATMRDSLKNQELFKLTSGYDLAISLRMSCYWFKHKKYEILCYKNGKWSQFTLLTDIQNKKKEIQEGKIKIIKHKANQVLCDSVWSFLIRNSLLTMNNDSLNVYEKGLIYKAIEDGVFYEFIIRTNSKMRVINSYEPDEYYKWLPFIEERKYFINCRDKFQTLWKH